MKYIVLDVNYFNGRVILKGRKLFVIYVKVRKGWVFGVSGLFYFCLILRLIIKFNNNFYS